MVFNAQNIQRLPVTVSAAKAMEVKPDVSFDGLTMHTTFTILGVWFYTSDNLNHDSHLTNNTRPLIDIDSDNKKRLAQDHRLYERLVTDSSITVTMTLINQGGVPPWECLSINMVFCGCSK